ncbi:multicopper oxidase-domain-containing protein [Microdochium bolleyi]|uniref:Multicopper oxidase-domain-containing protein n=1 Tax=Microdochium bolleyi TaxID=196109 RepID=A0A136J059_9PEZI|nr:multicopper oxidase-domain-containing protein [Microdochium bolleyi]
MWLSNVGSTIVLALSTVLPFHILRDDDHGDGFVCEYPKLKGWKSCSTKNDRSCWLKGPKGERYDINTDYETKFPEGKTRKYYLEVDKMTINGDGIDNVEGKGDIIEVTVKNKLKYNGTTIHWHGLRQLNSNEMDGVNGVTQCPIAPNDTSTYRFRAMQYGTSWYHSHYSLQYADGLAGPITIYGPSSFPYDSGIDPILMTDWNHRSAFQDWQRQLTNVPSFPKMNSALMNGIGNFAGSFPHERFNKTVEAGKKYLLRLINTSVDTTWIFSIDNHNLTVMSSDFVPIEPYNTSQVVLGIGQRYHVVLHAGPIDNDTFPADPDNNYWIRMVAATDCKGFEDGNEPDERQGILRYNSSSTTVPTTFRPKYSVACRDEDYNNLKPIHKWSIDPVPLFSDNQNAAEQFDIGKDYYPKRPAAGNNFTWWSFGDKPLWLNFSDPTILNLNNKTWNPDYVVIPEDRANAWVYLVITAPGVPQTKFKDRSFFPVAHPMHLHGHDFALLAQGTNSSELQNAKLKFDNPPRRDVALLPSGGYLVIAFKADNPGSWLFHCHIAWHASSGLALQILERQADLREMMTGKRLAETRRVCKKWDEWFSNPKNHWEADAPFQDDAGI